MASRKYSTRKRNDDNKEANGIIGLIFIIVSAFFLICLIVTPILSTIGYAVRGLLLSLLGFFSYPFFVCMLFVGISLLRSMKLRVSSKTVLLMCAVAITMVFLLQTVISGGISGELDEYISYVWNSKNTAGGLLFGILAYAIQLILSKVGAIIFYSLLLAVFISLIVYKALVSSGVISDGKKEKQAKRFAHGEAPPAMVMPVRNTDLYVDTIAPKVNRENSYATVSEQGVASKIRSEEKPAVEKYTDKKIEFENKDVSAEKQNAKKILFGDKEYRSLNATSPFSSSYGGSSSYGSSSSSYGSSYGSGSSYGGSFGSKKYGSGYEEQLQNFRKLSENTIPDGTESPKKDPQPTKNTREDNFIPEKDFSSKYVGGVIINGDEVAALHQMHDKPVESETVRREEEPKDRGYEYKYSSSDDGRPPIINGDFFGFEDMNGAKRAAPKYNDERKNNSESAYSSESKSYERELTQKVSDKHTYDEEKDDHTTDSYKVSGGREEEEKPDEPDHSDLSQADRQKNAEESINRLINAERSMRDYFDLRNREDSDLETKDKPEDDEIEFTEPQRPINPTVTQFSSDGKSENERGTKEFISFEEPEVSDEEPTAKGDNENAFEEKLSEEFSEERDSEENEVIRNGIINGDNVEATKGFNFIVETEDLSENDAPDDSDSGYYEKVNAEKKNKIDDSEDMTIETKDDNVVEEEARSEENSEENSEKKDAEKDERFALMQSYVSAMKPKKDKVSDNQIDIDEYMANSAPEVNAIYSIKCRYSAPPLALLRQESTDYAKLSGDSEKNSALLEEVLESFKFPAKVIAVVPGPAVTRYELEIPRGVPIKKIEERAPDIAYELASNGKIRIETPIPGKKAVGVEVPNKEIGVVGLKDIIGSKEFKTASSPLTIALGKDIAGEVVLCNLEKMPHLLIAGSTNSGKSSCLNSIITSIIYKSSPEDVRLILIDPKQVEFTMYNGIPHLLIKDVIKDTEQAVNALKWAIDEMENRYSLFSNNSCRNIKDYNALDGVSDGTLKKLPYIVIIVDEFSALMGGKNKDIEEKIIKIAQKSRAAGIHLILATQRPSVDVITGTIKANLPSRIAFAVTSFTDSRTILDKGGAETLLGRGDMLYSPIDYNEPKRVQGAYIDAPETADIVNYAKTHNKCVYYEDAEQVIKAKAEEKNIEMKEDDGDAMDPLIPDVLKCIIETNQVSATMIQRRFAVGYARAARILDQMEMHQFVSPSENKKPREIYITREMYDKLFGNNV